MYESTWMFCLKRILTLPFVLLGVSILTFVFIRFVPIEPAEVILRLAKVTPTEEAIQALREELGTDKPLLIQYLLWLIGVLQFDFGTSFVSKLPVAHELFAKLPATIELAVAAFVLILVFSIPLGMISALYKCAIIDKIIRLFSILSVSIPTFWLGFLLLYLFSLKWWHVQRVMIALSLAIQSTLYIADEPTTALDTVNQKQVLTLFDRICSETGAAIILVTHDLGVIAELADDVAVMYKGEIIEQANVFDFFDAPQHPYTKKLLQSRITF
ncbi:Vitamin B12 import ATP-binding protein BtuD [Lysinibacillus sphaericus]